MRGLGRRAERRVRSSEGGCSGSVGERRGSESREKQGRIG